MDVVEAHPDWTVDVRLVDAETEEVLRDWWSPVKGEIVVVPKGALVDVRQRTGVEATPKLFGELRWQEA